MAATTVSNARQTRRFMSTRGAALYTPHGEAPAPLRGPRTTADLRADYPAEIVSYQVLSSSLASGALVLTLSMPASRALAEE